MSKTTHVDFLERVELFNHVSRDTIEAFAACCLTRTLLTGEALFEEGQPGDFLFVLLRGTLAAFAKSGRGEPLFLRALTPGDVGGLTSLTLDQPRSATLRATRPCQVLTVEKARFLSLLSAHPDLSGSLIAVLSRKVRGKTRQIASFLEPAAALGFRIAFFDTKPYDKTSFLDCLGEDRDLQVTFLGPRLDAQTVELAAGHQAVCAFVNCNLAAPTLERLVQLGISLVALRCAGFNNVDLEAARKLGITVLRVPAYSPHAVAEHALALLLTLNRKTHRAFNRVHEGNFSLQGLVGFDLYEKTAGIIGMGQIGRCMAQICAGLKMTVLAFDVSPDESFARATGIRFVSLDELLERSDVLSLHAPLVPATRHLINAQSLRKTKRGVVILNTSRGGLIDSRALIDALKSGHLGGAGLDVYEEESEYFFEDHSDVAITDDLLARLLTFNNVIITSHQGFLTREALGNIARTTLDNIRAFARAGEDLENQVSALARLT